MLFPPKARRKTVTRTRYVVGNGKAVPKGMTVLCHSDKHLLPVAKEFVKVEFTKNGTPYALYECPLCGRKQAWIYDSATGKPMLLWFRN